jgi:hypothetical protein
MTKSIGRFQFSIPRFNIEPATCKAVDVFKETFSFLGECFKSEWPALGAMGYKLTSGSPTFWSTTFACAAAKAAAYAAPLILSKGAAKLLLKYSDKLFVVWNPAEGGSLLQSAIRFGMKEMVKKLIQAGASVDERNSYGESALQIAVKMGLEELVDVFLEAGANVEAANIYGVSTLIEAVMKNNYSIARKLVRYGADPYFFRNGLSSFSYTKDMQMVRILTGTDTIAAFNHCRDLHDFFEVLFPPFRKALPPNWQSIVDSLERESDLTLFLQEMQKMNKKGNSLNKYAQDQRFKMPTIHAALRDLQQKSPYFAKAWEIANVEKLVKLEEHPDEVFADGGDVVHERGTSADYTACDHLIRISNVANGKEKMINLVFETLNALQRKTIQKRTEWVWEGRLCRESFALITERVELNSYQWRQKIMEGRLDFESESFDSYWRGVNAPYSEGLIAHAEFYRREWDRHFGFKFLVKNRDWLRERLNELRSGLG